MCSVFEATMSRSMGATPGEGLTCHHAMGWVRRQANTQRSRLRLWQPSPLVAHNLGRASIPTTVTTTQPLCYCGYVKDSKIGTLPWVVQGSPTGHYIDLFRGTEGDNTHTREDTEKMMWLKRQSLDWYGHKARVPSIIREGTGKDSVSLGVCRDSSAWRRFSVRFILDSGLPAEEQLYGCLILFYLLCLRERLVVAQTGLELELFLPLPPTYSDCRIESSHPRFFKTFLK